MKMIMLILMLSCSSDRGFLINNYQPKDKRIGETTFINQEITDEIFAKSVKYSIKEHLSPMEKCVEDSSEPVSFAFKFLIDPQGKVTNNTIENLRDKEQKKCLNNILANMTFQQPENSGQIQVYQLITLNRN